MYGELPVVRPATGARGTTTGQCGAAALDTHEVTFRGAVVACTPGEFAILELMASEPGWVFSRDQLLSHVHGLDGYISRRTVDVHVASLRKKDRVDQCLRRAGPDRGWRSSRTSAPLWTTRGNTRRWRSASMPAAARC